MDKGFGQNVQWDIPLLEGYNYSFLKNISKRESMDTNLWDAVNPSIVSTIFKNKSSIVIVSGWSYFSDILTIVTACLLGRRIWLRAENPLNQELKKSSKTLFIKKLILGKLLFPLIDKFLYIGTE
ncbi:MAG: hypothetical protein ABIP51_14410, partial [Bacteroidia bacterium]